jgi:hypothetical protein
VTDPKQDVLAKARLKLEQAKARVQALEARQSQTERKLDTRRKIILGGLLIDAAGKDERFANVVGTLMGYLTRPNDQKAFEGWSLPAPETLVPAAAPEPKRASAPPADATTPPVVRNSSLGRQGMLVPQDGNFD